MGWLDPKECMAAEDCLKQGNFIEAAEILLASKSRSQRAARQLLLKINERLVEQAGKVYANGELDAAEIALDYAQRCAALDPKGAALKAEIDCLREKQTERLAHRQGRMGEAVHLADEGRVRTAMGIVQCLTEGTDVGRVKTDLDERLERFERYIRETQELLDEGELEVARLKLQHAREIISNDPEVLRLAKAIRYMMKSVPSATTTGEVMAKPVDRRSMTFALAHRALFISRSEVVIGNPRDQEVDIPIQAKIHRRHALLVRNRSHYRVIPFERCNVSVNGTPIQGESALENGDTLEFGQHGCRWVFRLPVAGSGTAVLEHHESTCSGVVTPSGANFRRVVLVEDYVRIGVLGDVHLRFQYLPCESVDLKWTKCGLIACVKGGTLMAKVGEHTFADRPVSVFLPSELLIESNDDEAERLGRAFAGHELSDSLELEVYDPNERRVGYG